MMATALSKFPIEDDWERAQAANLERELGNASDHVPGWMFEASGLNKVIDLIDDAIMEYDEAQGVAKLGDPGDDTNGMDPRYLAQREEDLLDATEEEEEQYDAFHRVGKNPEEPYIRDMDSSTP